MEDWFLSSSDPTKKVQLTINDLDTECDCNNCNGTCETSCDLDCSDCPYDFLVSHLLLGGHPHGGWG